MKPVLSSAAHGIACFAVSITLNPLPDSERNRESVYGSYLELLNDNVLILSLCGKIFEL